MEISQLRALRELRERGSIAAVAAAMRVTPSSVSQQISALQRHSSVPLTYKDGRRTALTPAGHALAAAAVDVEVAMARARHSVDGFREDASGAVSVAAFHSAATAVFGPLLRRLAGAPQTVSLRDFDVAQAEFPGLTADHDLVLSHRLAGSDEWPSWVRAEPLFYEPLDIAMRHDHPLAGESVIRPEQLRGVDWVAVHEGYPLAQAIAVISTVSGRQARIPHRINEFLVAASVVASSDCVALLPRFTTGLKEHPGLALRPLDLPGIGRHVDCLVRPETLERRAVQSVLDHIRTIADGLRGDGR